MVHSQLRQGIRDLERLLITSPNYNSAHDRGGSSISGGGGGGGGSGISIGSSTGSGGSGSQLSPETAFVLSPCELGQLLAVLHRVHHILVFNSSHFDETSLRQVTLTLTLHVTLTLTPILTQTLTRTLTLTLAPIITLTLTVNYNPNPNPPAASGGLARRGDEVAQRQATARDG